MVQAGFYSHMVECSTLDRKVPSSILGRDMEIFLRVRDRDIFSIFFNIKVGCLFSLESPHQGNSNEYTEYIIFKIKKKITLDYPKSAAMVFFLGTQEQVRNRHGKRAISVRAIEVILYNVWPLGYLI